jgi:hypothetical protein
MSLSNVPTIMGRIKSARENSAIAVFKGPKFKAGMLDAVFASTCKTVHRLNKGDKSLVGVFYKGMDMPTKAIVKALNEACQEVT